MGVQSTVEMSRESTIERIKEIHSLILVQDYRRLETTSFEPNADIAKFVNQGVDFSVENINKWTNRMLEDVLDIPGLCLITTA